MQQVKGPRQQKARSETGLNAEALLVQKIGEAHRVVEIQPLARGNQRQHKPAKKSEQYPHRAAVHQGSLTELPHRGHGTRVSPIRCGDQG